MNVWCCRAKINLYLRVLGRRPDGYHEIETVFQEIDLADEIHWMPGARPLRFRAIGPVTCPEPDNLVTKAVAAFSGATGIRVGGRMTLVKRIPIGAGLGGGSSDAAGVLKGLNRRFDRPLKTGALTDLMAELGSDVPFFLRGGTQIGRSRGQLLAPLPEPSIPRRGILLFPPCALSTAAVYARCAEAKPWVDRPRGAVTWGENDLLAPALACSTTLRRVYTELAPIFADELFFMTGSGSTFVWLTAKPEPVEEALAARLRKHSITWHPFAFAASSGEVA